MIFSFTLLQKITSISEPILFSTCVAACNIFVFMNCFLLNLEGQQLISLTFKCFRFVECFFAIFKNYWCTFKTKMSLQSVMKCSYLKKTSHQSEIPVRCGEVLLKRGLHFAGMFFLRINPLLMFTCCSFLWKNKFRKI